MSFAVKGKTVIVTGAANGIGLAVARHMADKGANVMCADAHEKKLVEEFGTAPEDGNIRTFAGDLRQRLTIANLVSATIDAFDQVDVLVNASRQMVHSDPLNPDDDAVHALLQQNLMAPLRLSQMVAKRMIKQADGQEDGAVGSIINLSSIMAIRAHPDLMAVSISNAALEQMTRSLAVALASERIRVNAVAMGSVMSASMQERLKAQPDFRHVIEAGTPLGRIASATELAETVQFLASDGSGFMTGQVLVVDGGRTLLDPVTAPAH